MSALDNADVNVMIAHVERAVAEAIKGRHLFEAPTVTKLDRLYDMCVAAYARVKDRLAEQGVICAFTKNYETMEVDITTTVSVVQPAEHIFLNFDLFKTEKDFTDDPS